MARNMEAALPNFFVMTDTNLPNPTVLLFPDWRTAKTEYDAQRAKRVKTSQQNVRMGRLNYHQEVSP